MKRVKAAYICQTIHFMLKEDMSRDYALSLVKREVEQYKKWLEQGSSKYKIVEEAPQEDGSVVLKVIRQYNSTPVGNYLD